MDFDSEPFPELGSDFAGFPKRLPDDTVNYSIYIVDAALTDSQIRSRLAEVHQTAKDLVRTHLKDYIWQREPFSLKVIRDQNSWLLTGSTSFGDSVNDEWIVVYILRELSKKFADAWIKTSDNDGEFLLIEAADFIPGWVDPDIIDNRVWLHNGQIWFISPLAFSSTGETRPLTTQEAIGFIGTDASRMCHVAAVDRDAFHRIRGFPESIKDNLHTSLVTIPRRLAWILHRNALYISPAIEAFYLRYPISMKTLANKDGSALRFPPEDFVTVSARFNRAGYAQLKSQRFDIPQAWAEKTPNSASAVDAARVELGMKLTCGFEMLLADPRSQNLPTVREIGMLLEDLNNDEEALPTDDEIESWPKLNQDDRWRNISMDDFDDLLSGRRPSVPGQGFGDRETQENLRRMVERFKKIMEDEENGESMTDADDDKALDSSDEEGDDIEFDPLQYAQIMRHAVVIPPNLSTTELDSMMKTLSRDKLTTEDEFDDIQNWTKRMEAELDAAGAFRLDADTKARLRASEQISAIAEEDEDESSDEGALEIDFNVAKDLLAKLDSSSAAKQSVSRT